MKQVWAFARENAATAIFLAILVVVVIIFLGKFSTTRQQQITSCERGNNLRLVLSVNEQVQYDFLFSAQKGREEAAKSFRKAGDDAQADINAGLANDYKEYLSRLRTVPQIDCEAVIK